MRKCVMGIAMVICMMMTSVVTVANEPDVTEEKYYLGELYNTGKDNGYSKRKPVKKGDIHNGWELGKFFVTGYTRQSFDEDGTPVFLKNVGDEVTLWFDLQQDISALNGDNKLYITEDKNGYEDSYGVKKSNLKKGALIIKHTDYQNKDGEAQKHIDYLAAKVSKDANTEVLFCEEGDYEVSLLYEIKDDNFLFFDSCQNYRIDLKFSVRNGNTMVFPFDAVTGQELTNNVFTENGFYLDLANSKYLNIDVKREVLIEGVDGLVEDVRYNRPAKDGEQFVEEGIYTITATNQYTNVTTEKKIYVGENSLLKAHVFTGMELKEIKEKVSNGEVEIDQNGNVIPVSKDILVPSEMEEQDEIDKYLYIILVGIVLACVLIVVLIAVRRKKKRRKMTTLDAIFEELEEKDK